MSDYIHIKNATEHNLKGISLQIPKNKITVFTGVSGSGKSTLAFNTIYAEGQRRYLESLSAYSRQFLGSYSKPEVEIITGLCPTIAISQKTYSYNPRSTVATVTEIYDYLRLLFAKIGIPYSPQTNQPIKTYSKQEIVDSILLLPEGTKVYIISPLSSEQIDHEIENVKRKGFVRIAINSKILSIYDKHTINPGDKVSVVVDRIIVNNLLGSRIASSIDSATELNCEAIEVEIFPNEGSNSYCVTFPVRQIKDSIEITPRLFSFNNPLGACKKCKGIGKISLITPELVVLDQSKTLLEGAIWPFFDPSLPNIELTTYTELRKLLTRLAKKYQFNLNTPWKDLPADIQYILLYGSQEDDFKGVVPILESDDQEMHPLIKQRATMHIKPSCCPECKGYRLNSNALYIKIAGLHIGEMNAMCIDDAEPFFKSLPTELAAREQKIAAPVLSEICKRLSAIRQIGLGYLTLNREAGTLSGGEAQRVRIVSQIGTGLSGIIYVLDEPSIGLHYNEKASLLTMIQELKELGNTVIIVEHDEEMISNADHIVELGPKSGYHGGQIVATGTLEEIKNNPNSITGCYLSGRMFIASPARNRTYDRVITMCNVNKNNLVNINVTIPLGVLVAVTGASGSGKSTLISDILGSCTETLHRNIGMATYNPHCQSITGLEYVTSIIQINNNALTKTIRSNPATYINILNDIRGIFAAQSDAKSLGFGISKFSFNSQDGKCSMCNGHGTFKVEMHFLADVDIICESCNGKRYNREALMVKYRGKNIADIMELTVDEAVLFFSSFANICKKLLVLQKVGLGYLRIGQTANTLSGGEAQRIKIAKELSRGSGANMLYIMDEPTTGLHTHDIKNLIMVLNQLIDKGNTVVVIEHNINVIKNADYIIEMGHGGGRHGGKIIAYGTPNELANNHNSCIGQYLR